MSVDADFWVPYEGGHLPMGIIRIKVSTEGGTFGPRVEMKIDAVSVGAPVFSNPWADQPWALPAAGEPTDGGCE